MARKATAFGDLAGFPFFPLEPSIQSPTERAQMIVGSSMTRKSLKIYNNAYCTIDDFQNRLQILILQSARNRFTLLKQRSNSFLYF